jgi:hypothetical protein
VGGDVRVRDLIAGSTFTPGAARSSATAPRVTVILPTFRRGDSGWLERAIDSLLEQTFEALEVIVVDDASTDSSAGVIADAMARDPRVSVIRHARNIGLPAVSEYEAFVIARGDLIAFAFDDTVFYPEALATLVRASEEHPDALISAYVTAYYRVLTDDAIHSRPFGRGVRESDFLAANPIPNSGVLMPKAILEVVGLYDPHVALARNCDYDLWFRIRRRFPVVFLPDCIGEEHGTASHDSLGLTYPLDHWGADDRMRQRRDHLLTPDAFPDIDVLDLSCFASEKTRTTVQALVDGHVRTRDCMSPERPTTTASALAPRVLVVAHPINASTQLVFEGLRDVAGLHVRTIDPTERPMSEVAGADVLIISRRVRYYGDWIRFARRLGVSTYFYIDDNLPLMAASGELDPERSQEFSIANQRDELARFDGVLASTEALAQSLRDQGLHPRVATLDLVVPGVVAEGARGPAPTDRPARFALFAGAHRLPAFRQVVWPALLETAGRSDRTIELLVPAPSSGDLGDLGDFGDLNGGDLVSIRTFASSGDYFTAARNLGEAGVDVVIVPGAATVNAPFKTVHPFLTASILGSALVAPDVEPYRSVGGEVGVSLVQRQDSSSAWADALCLVLDARERGPRDAWTVSREFLTTRFSPEVGAARLLAALADGLPPREPDPHQRMLLATEWLAIELSMHLASRDASPGTTLNPAGPPRGPGVALARAARRSRLLTALRVRALSVIRRRDLRESAGGWEQPPRGRETIERSVPLATVPYVSHPVALRRGMYRTVRAMMGNLGAAGDECGVEVVGPRGEIVFCAETEMSRVGEPVKVTFDARGFSVPMTGMHEVRVFVRGSENAFLLQKVTPRPLGLRRPRVRPMIAFERE